MQILNQRFHPLKSKSKFNVYLFIYSFLWFEFFFISIHLFLLISKKMCQCYKMVIKLLCFFLYQKRSVKKSWEIGWKFGVILMVAWGLGGKVVRERVVSFMAKESISWYLFVFFPRIILMQVLNGVGRFGILLGIYDLRGWCSLACRGRL